MTTKINTNIIESSESNNQHVDTGWLPSPSPEERDAVLNALRKRRSIGKVLPDTPSREKIEQVLEAAVWAPNHRLSQPWRFFVLAGEARAALGDAMAHATEMSTTMTADPEKVRTKPLRAPVIIAVAVEPADGPKIVEIEEICAVAAAAQNMLLAAHALGLAAIWRTGDQCFSPSIRDFFGLSARGQVLGFIYLGYPGAQPPHRERTPASAHTVWLGWEDKEDR